MSVKRFFKNAFYIIWGYFLLCMLVWAFSEIRGSWVEWDDHYPQLHDQMIRFNQPMMYLEGDLTQRYSARGFGFKYLLATQEDEQFFRAYQPNLKQVQIKKDMQFKIAKTFRFSNEWFEGDIAQERRLAILLDEKNREIVLGDFIMFEQSNRPEFAKFKF